jgi:hypothetical protein
LRLKEQRTKNKRTEDRAAIRQTAIREATMDKVNEPFFYSSAEPICETHAVGRTYSDTPLYIKDKRVAQLLVLLQQLQESVGRLGALPKPELFEIVSSAVQLCGFVNQNEMQVVIVIILDAFEMQGPTLESP